MRPRYRRFWKRQPDFPSAQQLFEALDENGWHAGRASRALGIGRATLWRHLAAAGISLRKEKKKVWSRFSFAEKFAAAAKRYNVMGRRETI